MTIATQSATLLLLVLCRTSPASGQSAWRAQTAVTVAAASSKAALTDWWWTWMVAKSHSPGPSWNGYGAGAMAYSSAQSSERRLV
jgi:hypothetical protein